MKSHYFAHVDRRPDPRRCIFCDRHVDAPTELAGQPGANLSICDGCAEEHRRRVAALTVATERERGNQR